MVSFKFIMALANGNKLKLKFPVIKGNDSAVTSKE